MRLQVNISILLVSLFLISCSSSYNSYSTAEANSHNPLQECPSTPNCERIAFTINEDIGVVFDKVINTLEQMNAEEITIDKQSQRIDAVFKIPVFGYRDDVAVVVTTDTDSTTMFIRSSSREGHWDIWVNKIRVKKIIKRTKQSLSK